MSLEKVKNAVRHMIWGQPKTSLFDTLPEDIKGYIFQKADVKELGRLSQVNKNFKGIISQDFVWRDKNQSLTEINNGNAQKIQYRDNLKLISKKAEMLKELFDLDSKWNTLMGPDNFTAYASKRLVNEIFNNELNPSEIINEAIKNHEFTHGLTNDIYERQSNFLEVLSATNLPHILKEYITKYKEELNINAYNAYDETPLVVSLWQALKDKSDPNNTLILLKHDAELPKEYDLFEKFNFEKIEELDITPAWAEVIDIFLEKGYDRENLAKNFPVFYQKYLNYKIEAENTENFRLKL